MREYEIGYLKHNKKKGNFSDEILKLSGNNLNTIVEALRDYSIILIEQAQNIIDGENVRRKLSLEIKAKECNEIADKIAEEIGYCKNCENAKSKTDDIGADAMTLIANGYKH